MTWRRPRAEVHRCGWLAFPGGLHWIGHDGSGFAFDNEGPQHRVYLEPFRIASRAATIGEYLAFMDDGGYARPELWLSDGWAVVQSQHWEAPLYWERVDGEWRIFTLGGLRRLDKTEPACHVSYYEADAFARWSGARLATEAEWEVAAVGQEVTGNLVESGHLHPRPADTASRPGSGFRRRLGVDAEPVHALSGLAARGGCAGRVQREVHVQSARAPRRLVCDAGLPHPGDLPEFLPARSTLAIQRHPTGERLMTISIAAPRGQHEPATGRDRFLRDVLLGLRKTRKSVPCKYFYDEAGSHLFDAICDLDEYYLTRTETDILRAHAGDMAAEVGEDVDLIELGSGSSLKTRLLIERLRSPRAYLPVDISGEHLERSARSLARRFPGLRVEPVHADFTLPFALPDTGDPRARRVVYFPGSTIGNFGPAEALGAPAVDRSARRRREGGS